MVNATLVAAGILVPVSCLVIVVVPFGDYNDDHDDAQSLISSLLSLHVLL